MFGPRCSQATVIRRLLRRHPPALRRGGERITIHNLRPQSGMCSTLGHTFVRATFVKTAQTGLATTAMHSLAARSIGLDVLRGAIVVKSIPS